MQEQHLDQFATTTSGTTTATETATSSSAAESSLLVQQMASTTQQEEVKSLQGAGEEVGGAPAGLTLPTLLFLLHLMKADDGQAKQKTLASSAGGGRGVAREKRPQMHHAMKPLQGQRQPKGAGRHLQQPRGGQQRPCIVTSKQH